MRPTIGACLFVFTVCGVPAQDHAGRLEFEAASVKLHTAASPSTGRSGIEETQGLIRIENLSLKVVIQTAYGVKDFQIAGPAWLGTVCFDIAAKPPAGYKHEQLQPLLCNLLADRFKLAVHHDSKETSGFALVVAKGEHKLHEATGPRGFFTGRPGLIAGTRVSMGELASVLARMLGRPVVDRTGLTAAYDVKVEWTPDQAPQAPGGDQTKEASEPELSLFTALHDQLGLRLQTQKVSVEVVIVDHVEKVPTEN
ncbi:MAG: TIGR03435 family protein [Bryobacteraceae bacterium]